jgi:hypothetical protein
MTFDDADDFVKHLDSLDDDEAAPDKPAARGRRAGRTGR